MSVIGDIGMTIEFRLREAIKSKKDFYQFAGVVRTLIAKAPGSKEDKEALLEALADEIKDWKEYR